MTECAQNVGLQH